jgi:hypothetical protein
MLSRQGRRLMSGPSWVAQGKGLRERVQLRPRESRERSMCCLWVGSINSLGGRGNAGCQ